MKLPTEELQKAYYTALNGNITYNGSNVPVYDAVPESASYPYIRLAEFFVTPDNTKDTYISNVITQVDVVTAYDGSFGGKKASQNISDQITRIIVTRGSYLPLNGFNMFVSTLDIASSFETQTESHNLYIKRIRFSHKIEEL